MSLRSHINCSLTQQQCQHHGNAVTSISVQFPAVFFFFHTFVFSFSSQGTFLQQTITFQNILQGFAVGLLLPLIICRNNKPNLKESLCATLHKRAKLYLYSKRKYWKCRSKDILSKETFFFFLFPNSINTLSLALANMVN